MVKNNLFLFVVVLLLVSSCNRNTNNVAIADLIILNKSFLDVFDTIESELPEFDTGYFSQFMQDFDSKRCNILVRITVNNGDTLLDFYTFDTTNRQELKNIPVNGLFKIPNGKTIFISDKEEIAKGVIYETRQTKKSVQLDISQSLHKPMVLRNGKLKINPPPLISDDDESANVMK